MILKLLISTALICVIYFAADWLVGVDWKSYVVGIICAFVSDLLWTRSGNAAPPDPPVSDEEMAALRKALERQIERDEARHG